MKEFLKLKISKILITGGAGFIGSNLIDYFLHCGHHIVCLDDLSTGFEYNISHHFNNPKFKFIKGDIREIEDCRKAIQGCDYVSHQAALGSVPRSIIDPANTNSVNISGFVNMLIAARDQKVKRFVYAASSSTYGDSKKLPKLEEEIGKPLSPYAITKYVNELYAEVFAKTYGMQCIGLRYFNVFGKRQHPNGAYAAVIPLWAKKFIDHQNPIINGDGNYSRDFTFINNVVEANDKATFTSLESIIKGQREYYNFELDDHKYLIPENNDSINLLNKKEYISEVFNIACGGNTTLLDLFKALRTNLAKHDKTISTIQPEYGPLRVGDIPHSEASIMKAKKILGYTPHYNIGEGLKEAVHWYYNNLKK
jgi:UDP-N-acetylglucosamine/UDP-N-acetylgalactosamine 4-epimerase